MRRTLVAALVSCAGEEARTRLRRFLAGLSADELEFLAGFQGARILERGATPLGVPFGVPHGTCGPADYGCAADRDHKMIVLCEYLARCGWGRF
ncbi:MAG: hypothetical protein ACLQU1_07875 [Bryobacteraceae bacterium]